MGRGSQRTRLTAHLTPCWSVHGTDDHNTSTDVGEPAMNLSILVTKANSGHQVKTRRRYSMLSRAIVPPSGR